MDKKTANKVFYIFAAVLIILGALIVQWNRIWLYIDMKNAERVIARNFEVVNSQSECCFWKDHNIDARDHSPKTRYEIAIAVKSEGDDK